MKPLSIFVLLCTLAPVCLAQTGGVPHPLTLADAVARARANSPRIQGASAEVERAQASIETAREYSNPSIEIHDGHQSARDIEDPGVPGVLQHYAIEQPIEVMQERRARREVAVAGRRSAASQRDVVSLSVVADAQHAFYDALRRRDEIRYAEENLQLVQDLRRRVQVEVDVGEKGGLELTRAEAEIGRARFAVRSAQIAYSNAIASLRAAIAASPEEELDPQGAMQTPVTLPTLPEARAMALASHPSIAQAQADIDRSQANLADQKALRIPRPSLFAEYENLPDIRFWRAGVNLELPLFDRRRGYVADARAGIEGSNAAMRQRHLELISAVERAYEQYSIADQQVASLESGELHAAESAVAGAQAAYRFGERGIVEVLDAQRVLQSVRLDLLDAQYLRQSAIVDLEELGVKP